MKKSGSNFIVIALIAAVVIAIMWGIGIRNKFVNLDEDVQQSWGQVENVYKRRADLLAQVVSTVQGAANYEKGTLTEVIEARSKVGSVQIDANNLTEEKVAEFQRAQDNLSNALTRSMNVIVERYPELTATKGFQDLQVQIEGCENRISTERGRFNEKVGAYNKMIRKFPNNVIASLCGFDKKGYFKAPEGAENPAEIHFEF